MFRFLCKLLSFNTVVVYSVENHLDVIVLGFQYLTYLHALLFSAEIFFTARSWLDKLPCVKFATPKYIPNVCNEKYQITLRKIN